MGSVLHLGRIKLDFNRISISWGESHYSSLRIWKNPLKSSPTFIGEFGRLHGEFRKKLCWGAQLHGEVRKHLRVAINISNQSNGIRLYQGINRFVGI